jgi:hypothetical protein
MSGTSVFTVGLRRVLHRPGIVFGLWLLSLGTALLAALPIQQALFENLDRRPAAFLLARGQADGLWTDVVSGNGALRGLSGALGSGVLIGVLFLWVVETLLSGGLVSALLRPGHPAHAPPGRVLIVAAETAGGMLRLELLGIVALRLPLLLLFGVAAYLLGTRLHVLEASAAALVWRFAPLAFLLFLLYSVVSVILHYARISYVARRAARGAISSGGGATAALQRGLHLFVKTRWNFMTTLSLGIYSILGYGVLIIAGRVVAARLDYALLIVLALLVRQVFALCRTVLALSVMATATEVVYHQKDDLLAYGPVSSIGL